MGRRGGSKGGAGEAITPESALAAALSGRRISGIEGGEFDWVFSFDDATLATESPWRILVEGRIVLSSGDHGQQFGLPGPIDAEASAQDLLARKRIQEVGIRTDTGDLTLVLEARTVLEVLNMSSGYEAWRVTADELDVVALGGGEVTMLSPD